MAAWVERYEALKSQAEELASSAHREVEARAAAGEGSSAQNLQARRKIMDMGRVITSMDKLAADNMCGPPTGCCDPVWNRVRSGAVSS